MIASIRGKLIEKTPTHCVIDVNGIGFLLHISLSSYEKLGESGETAAVYTYLHTREDALQLYGFAGLEERALFQHLISVSGIGPKLALGILSGLEAEVFREAVSSGNVEALTRAPGVGRKTAERLILELREKLGPVSPPRPADDDASSEVESTVQALISLGFKKPRVREVVEKMVNTTPGLTIEEMIRLALREL
jgi:Holliday junction DNA helicase RuvA